MSATNPQIEMAILPQIPSLEETEEAHKIVRPDRNLEKWPIWEPSNSRHAPKSRLIQREVSLPDGSKAVAMVEVGFTNKGVLTTEDQKTCYGLIKIWEDKKRPTGAIYFSRQQLARVLKKSWGSKVNSSLTASLMRLRFTPFTWERSYYDNMTKEIVERIDTFNILSELHLARRTKDGNTIGESSYFEFNERVLKNLLSHFTKPVFLDTILSFQSEIAQILYTHLDLVLSDKNHYERRTRELFEDLGLDGTAYRYPSKRAQMLEPALRELQGKPLPTGTLKQVTLDKTADGKDFKIVARKEKPRGPKPGTRTKASGEPILFPPVVTDAAALPALSVPEREATDPEAALEQVRYFYQVFFKSGGAARPTAKELAQADDHLSRLGEEKARYLVTFAYREAKRTDFQIQTYGGIVQYEGRAITEYDENVHKRADALTRKARTSHEERFWEAYLEYLRETYARRQEAPSAAFTALLESDQKERSKFTRGPLAKNPAMKRAAQVFDEETARLKRFAEYFQEALGQDRVFTFWEWDERMNSDHFLTERVRAISDVR